MTRSELYERVRRTNQHLSMKEIRLAVDKIFHELTTALCRGEGAELMGFGRFGVKRRGPRRGRNPKTGAAVQIDMTYYSTFKMSSRILKLLNTSTDDNSAARSDFMQAENRPALTRRERMIERAKVYKFKKYDIIADTYVVAENMATREFIDAIRGEIIEGTELELDRSLISDGQAPLYIQPAL
jgi:integration host factor subunit beta